MNTTDELSGFEARLLTELRALVEPAANEVPALSRPTGWLRAIAARPVPAVASRRGRLVVGLVAAVLALSVLPSLVAPDRSSAFALTQLADGRIHVIVAADFDESQRLQRALEEVGVKVQIERLAAHPRLVGTIELVPLGPGGMSAAGAEGLEAGKGEFWIDPSRFGGSVELLIYATTDRGQSWQAAPSVFHPDEPLGGLPCAMEGALDTATLERFAAQVGISRIEWLPQPALGGRDFQLERTSKRPAGDVVAATMKSADELRVIVRPPGAPVREGALRPSMDLGLHTGEQPLCTAELAARWR